MKKLQLGLEEVTSAELITDEETSAETIMDAETSAEPIPYWMKKHQRGLGSDIS
jgi:hypothetical protein